jgi:hypothetical protein
MHWTHSIIFSALIVAASLGSVCAQRRERVPPPRDPQFYEPRNKLEEFESRLGTILIKGRTYVGTLQVREGSARVEATEIRDSGNSTRTTGVVITFTTVESGGSPGEARSLIDYEDIDPLIKAFDTAAKADESVTKLTHFEVRYRTRGDFEIMVFKQISGGVAASVEGGFFDRKRLVLTLDDFTKLRWMVAQAKDRLDQIPVP